MVRTGIGRRRPGGVRGAELRSVPLARSRLDGGRRARLRGSLEELHAQMFGYHFNLTRPRAPLRGGAGRWRSSRPGSTTAPSITTRSILFWAGVSAIVACAVLAWKRRSMDLVLIVAAFALPAGAVDPIERATFAYHYLTAVFFAMNAVAYVVDELLRRPAWRELAIGYLALVAIVGVLIFPLGAACQCPTGASMPPGRCRRGISHSRQFGIGGTEHGHAAKTAREVLIVPVSPSRGPALGRRRRTRAARRRLASRIPGRGRLPQPQPGRSASTAGECAVPPRSCQAFRFLVVG